MSVTLFGIVTETKKGLSRNDAPTVSTLLGTVIEVMPEPSNGAKPSLVTLFGITNEVKFSHPLKVRSGSSVIPFPITTEAKL